MNKEISRGKFPPINPRSFPVKEIADRIQEFIRTDDMQGLVRLLYPWQIEAITDTEAPDVSHVQVERALRRLRHNRELWVLTDELTAEQCIAIADLYDKTVQ